MIRTQSPDLYRARSLYKNGVSTIEDIPRTARARFRMLNYYSAILDLALSIMAIDGRKVVGADHHKEAIDYLSAKGFTAQEISLLQNLRFIRNDIQYYGTKSEDELEGFFAFHKEAIELAITKVASIAKLCETVPRDSPAEKTRR